MGIISAGINFRAQKLTNQTNLQIAQETNALNRELAEKQNQWNLEQWHRENAYNDPAAQAQRLQNAGLSAAAAAQQVNGGQASHLESVNLANQQAAKIDAPRMDFNLAQDALNIASAVGGAANAMKAFKEAKLTEDLIMTQIDEKRWTTNMMMQKYFQNNLENPYNLRTIRAQANSAEWRAQSDSFLPQLSQLAKDQQELNYKQTKWAFDNINPLTIQKMGEEIKNIIEDGKKKRAEISNIDADTANKVATHDNIVADTANKIATHDNIVADTENKRSQNANIEADTEVKKQDAWSKRISNTFSKYGVTDDAASRMGALCADGIISAQDAMDMTEHAIGYLKSSGKKFGLKPELRQYYNFVINPSAFEKYKSQSSWRTWWQDAQNEIGLPLDWSRTKKTSPIQHEWDNTQ